MNSKITLFPFVLVLYEVCLYLSNDMYLPSLPDISKDLQASQDMVQYTLSLWYLGTCSLQLFLTPLANRFGGRRTLLWGCGLFVISSFYCAISTTISELLWSRFFQGATVGTVTVVGYAMIHELYDSRKTIKLLSIMASIMVLAPALGPVIGASALMYTDWRGIFYIISILGLLSMIGLFLFVPKPSVRHKQSFTVILKAYWAVLMNMQFMRYAMGLGLIISAFFIWIVESPFVVVSGFKQTPFVFGIVQALVFLCFILGGQSARFLIDRLSVKNLVRAGLFFIFLGTLFFITVSAVLNNLWLAVGGMMLISFGAANLVGTLNRLAVESSSVLMVSRTAILSLITCFTGTFASFIMTLFNNQTFLSLALVMGFFLMVALLLIGSSIQKIELSD